MRSQVARRWTFVTANRGCRPLAEPLGHLRRLSNAAVRKGLRETRADNSSSLSDPLQAPRGRKYIQLSDELIELLRNMAKIHGVNALILRAIA